MAPKLQISLVLFLFTVGFVRYAEGMEVAPQEGPEAAEGKKDLRLDFETQVDEPGSRLEEHARKNLSVENLLCYRACKDFDDIHVFHEDQIPLEKDETRALAARYNNVATDNDFKNFVAYFMQNFITVYIEPRAEFEVNIDGATRAALLDLNRKMRDQGGRPDDRDIDALPPLIRKVGYTLLKLVQRDTFPKYKKSLMLSDMREQEEQRIMQEEEEQRTMQEEEEQRIADLREDLRYVFDEVDWSKCYVKKSKPSILIKNLREVWEEKELRPYIAERNSEHQTLNALLDDAIRERMLKKKNTTKTLRTGGDYMKITIEDEDLSYRYVRQMAELQAKKKKQNPFVRGATKKELMPVKTRLTLPKKPKKV